MPHRRIPEILCSLFRYACFCLSEFLIFNDEHSLVELWFFHRICPDNLSGLRHLLLLRFQLRLPHNRLPLHLIQIIRLRITIRILLTILLINLPCFLHPHKGLYPLIDAPLCRELMNSFEYAHADFDEVLVGEAMDRGGAVGSAEVAVLDCDGVYDAEAIRQTPKRLLLILTNPKRAALKAKIITQLR